MIMKKLISGILLSLVLVLIVGVRSMAYADPYDLWVGGTRVTDENKTDIPAAAGETRTGKASYDPTSKTLTLDNYSYNGKGYDSNSGGSYGFGIFTQSSSLTVVLKGKNSIIISGNAPYKFGVSIGNELIINGPGSLTATGTGSNDAGIRVIYNITINGGTVKANGVNGAYGIFSVGGNVTINSGNLTATGNDGIITKGIVTIKSGSTVIAAGTEGSIVGTVKNSIKGTRWDDKAGTQGKNEIPVNTTDGYNLSNYKKVQFPEELSQATVTDAPKAKTLTYTGSAQELVTAGTTNDGTMQYALGENGTTAPTTYISSIPSGTNAGIYYVWYMVDGDEWHRDADPKCIQVTIAEAKGSYSTVSGAQGIWQKGSGGNLSFRIKRSGNDEKTFNKFTGIQVDGKPVDKNRYEAKPGSVIIDLKPTYLETLSVGEHKLNVLFDDGNVETSFTIVGAETNTAGNLPKTGDAQNPLLYAVIALISVAGIGLFRKRME